MHNILLNILLYPFMFWPEIYSTDLTNIFTPLVQVFHKQQSHRISNTSCNVWSQCSRVTWLPRNQGFVGSNPTEVDGFSGCKISENESSGRDFKLWVPSLKIFKLSKEPEGWKENSHRNITLLILKFLARWLLER